MKALFVLACLLVVFAAVPATAASNNAPASACLLFAGSASSAQYVSDGPIVFTGGDPVVFFGEDPSGDGTDSCSIDDCKICNYNGLMCTPTPTGCNCDYWDQEM